MEEEKEELAIAEQLDNLQTVQDLTTLMREGKMKELYKKSECSTEDKEESSCCDQAAEGGRTW